MKKKKLDFPILRQNGPRGYSDWVRPVMKKYVVGCCDCGLAHEYEFNVECNGKEFYIVYRARRHAGWTNKLRKYRKFKKK